MDNTNVTATAVFGFVTLGSLLPKLYRKGLIDLQDVREIYDEALLNLEQNQAFAPNPDAIVLARAMLERAIAGVEAIQRET